MKKNECMYLGDFRCYLTNPPTGIDLAKEFTTQEISRMEMYAFDVYDVLDSCDKRWDKRWNLAHRIQDKMNNSRTGDVKYDVWVEDIVVLRDFFGNSIPIIKDHCKKYGDGSKESLKDVERDLFDLCEKYNSILRRVGGKADEVNLSNKQEIDLRGSLGYDGSLLVFSLLRIFAERSSGRHVKKAKALMYKLDKGEKFTKSEINEIVKIFTILNEKEKKTAFNIRTIITHDKLESLIERMKEMEY